MPEVIEAPAPTVPVEPAAAPPAPPAPAAPTSPLLTDGDPADPWTQVETKFHVKKEDGTLDHGATVAKLQKSYAEMQRMGSRTEPRPKTHDEYTVPEGAASFFDKADPKVGEFLKGAHGAALSQRQMDFVATEFARIAPQLVHGAMALDAKAAETTLRGAWGDAYEENVAAADRAITQLAPGDVEVLRLVQNRPPLIRLLSSIGKQLGEDTPPSGSGSTAAPAGIAELQSHPAYSDSKHPEHAAISQKVRDWYGRQPGADIPIG